MGQLSNKAVQDLRAELITVFGSDFELQDNELEEIGLFLLSSLAEALKLNKNGKIKPNNKNTACTDKLTSQN